MAQSRKKDEGMRFTGFKWPEKGPAQEKVIKDHCTYIYEDGARCIYVGILKDDLCNAHRLIYEFEKKKVVRRERELERQRTKRAAEREAKKKELEKQEALRRKKEEQAERFTHKERELEIIKNFLVAGYTTREISQMMRLSRTAVDRRINKIVSNLGLSSRFEIKGRGVHYGES